MNLLSILANNPTTKYAIMKEGISINKIWAETPAKKPIIRPPTGPESAAPTTPGMPRASITKGPPIGIVILEALRARAAQPKMALIANCFELIRLLIAVCSSKASIL